MRVIFLDFDGVLNSEKYLRASKAVGVIIDPSRMNLLKEIVNKTEAKIVLSTSWREHWEKQPDKCDNIGASINDIFSQYVLDIYDKTPKLSTGRVEEIKNWLLMHPDTETFLVLDDMLLCDDVLDGHFVKTSNYFNGLDESDVKRSIDILLGEI